MTAPQGHVATALAYSLPTQNYPPRLPALTRAPGRSHAENSGGTLRVSGAPQRKQRKQSRGARKECLALPRDVPINPSCEQGELVSPDAGTAVSPSCPHRLP